ncbi:uncharacterized protein [Rhodnius prolixus]|uniref:uncharacterized protein n=1 Tax=Rhodnius prolixus TaxID=13249 RepID=UPI003D1895CB
MEAAAAAGIAAKEAKLKEMQELELEELKLKQQKERLLLEAELAEVKARDQVLEQYEEGSRVSKSPKVSGIWGPNRHSGCNILEKDLVRMLIASNLKGQMPKVEIQKFNGDVTQYLGFIRSFDSVIGSKPTDDEEKLNYLVQYTVGTPRDIVKACMYMDPKEGYAEARALLDRRYGNLEKIIPAYIGKILEWPDIKPDDVERLDDVAILLRGCKNAIAGRAFGKSELQDPKTLRKILKKLPFNAQERFRRRADEIMDVERRAVEFKDLVTFVETEARIGMNPLFGRHLFRDLGSKRGARKRVGKEDSSRREAIGFNFADEEEPLQKCYFCGDPHWTGECAKLGSQDHEKKVEFVLKRRLCFGCLQLGHRSRKCSEKLRCKRCQGEQPTILHKEYPFTTKESLAETGRGPVCARVNEIGSYRMSVVPVKIKDSNGRSVETYAFLDSGSSVTFCSKDLALQLDPKGGSSHLIPLKVATIHKSATLNCGLVSGLLISDLEENNHIPLPPVYVVEELPVSKGDIVKRSDLEGYNNLSHLDIPDLDEEIGILIGINVPQALEPWDVIHSSSEQEPFAIKTRLGWVICGAPCTNRGGKERVNSLKLKNQNLDSLLTELYEKDFPEVNSARLGVSEEDRTWMSIIEQGCVKSESGKYEIPLPLRKGAELPNNKSYAMKRLANLKRRFEKDLKYKKDYCEFMNNMITQKNAEELPMDSTDSVGRHSWYIPHFGVYHPKNQGKLGLFLIVRQNIKESH